MNMSIGIATAMQPEYEQMRKLKLFSDEEISKIKKKRKEFDIKLSQPKRVIKDYVEYIKFERNLITQTKERSKEHEIATVHNILLHITDRMKKLYSEALSRFTNNVRFWDEYLKFLQTFKYTKDISGTFERMLQYHSDKADVWIRTILWESKENFTDEHVKNLVLRAQKLHPECQKIYHISFEIELENKCQNEELEVLKKAAVIYANGKKKFTNIDFYIDMLNIVDKFKYASSIQKIILNDMHKMFPKEELLWHTLAQRELKGLSTIDYPVDFTGLIKSERRDNTMDDLKTDLKQLKIENISATTQHTLRKRIQFAMDLYEYAVKKINTNKMWNYYIDATMDLNSDLTTQPSIKKLALQKAFEGAHEANQMSEYHYVKYIELLYTKNPKDDNIDVIFQRATQKYEQSAELWKMLMRYYIQKKNFIKVNEVFKFAKSKVGAQVAELWKFYLVYLKSCRSEEARKEFEQSIMDLAHERHATLNVLKAEILEILANTVNINEARKKYNLYIRFTPDSYELHDMMAELEAQQMKRDIEKERICMDNLIDNFGEDRIDVWLRYMSFERNAGESKYVSDLHRKGVMSLKPELLDEFNAQYKSFSDSWVV